MNSIQLKTKELLRFRFGCHGGGSCTCKNSNGDARPIFLARNMGKSFFGGEMSETDAIFLRLRKATATGAIFHP